MLTRVFNAAGLIVRIAEWKASLLAFAARRSAIAMLGYHIAALVALVGLAMLLGAGYVALETLVGVSLALAAVGVFLLIIASVIWLVANGRGKGKGPSLTEAEVRMNVSRDEELLRTILGLNNDTPDSNPNPPRSRMQSSNESEPVKGFNNPRVAMAAGFAMLGLLGPGRLFRAVRMATALASVAALANRAINEHRSKQDAQRAPQPPL